jgi:hypothetical protein
MRTLAGRLIVAVALVAAAVMARAEARQLRERADRLERLATLRPDFEGTVPATERATADYWRGDYDRLTGASEETQRDPDEQLLLIAANAAFRAAERTPQPRAAQVQQLDLVVQAYASALKAPIFVPDAAYNYEYVVRVRDSLARIRGGVAAPQRKTQASTGAADLPSGPTIHGRPGGPPSDTKGEEFEILTPMEYGDREAQPEPTTGVKPLRKG